MNWTEEMERRLSDLWAAGAFCSVIGKELGVSGSAIAGKAHRMNLPPRPSAVKGDGPEMARKRKATKARKSRAKAKAVPPSESPRKAVGVDPAPLAAPPLSACSWPIGEPRAVGFRFCGARPVVPGKPYCLEHCRVAYQVGSQRRVEA